MLSHDDIQLLIAFIAVCAFAVAAIIYVIWEEWKSAVKIDGREYDGWTE